MTHIGPVELDNPLFVKESFAPQSVRAKAFMTVGGGLTVYEGPKRQSANYITLVSQDTGWLKEQTIEAIRDLGDEIGARVEVRLGDGSSVWARFAHEKGEAIKATPLFDGSIWHKAEIALCLI